MACAAPVKRTLTSISMPGPAELRERVRYSQQNSVSVSATLTDGQLPVVGDTSAISRGMNYNQNNSLSRHLWGRDTTGRTKKAMRRWGSTVIRLALIAMLAAISLATSPDRSYACYCVPPLSASEALAKSATVFAGKVVTINDSGGSYVIVAFDVSAVWKGSASQTAYLTTPRDDGGCGFTFVEDEEYLVYSENGSQVFLCSRTSLLSEATIDLAELGEGQPPISSSDSAVPDVSEDRTRGGCGLGSSTADVSIIGLITGLFWLGMRKKLVNTKNAMHWILH